LFFRPPLSFFCFLSLSRSMSMVDLPPRGFLFPRGRFFVPIFLTGALFLRIFGRTHSASSPNSSPSLPITTFRPLKGTVPQFLTGPDRPLWHPFDLFDFSLPSPFEMFFFWVDCGRDFFSSEPSPCQKFPSFLHVC